MAIGEVKEIVGESIMEWKIRNFFSLSAKINKFYKSPSFSFANETWYFKIYPNGRTEDESGGCIDLYLNREHSGPPINIEYSFGLKTLDNKIENEMRVKYDFEKAEGYGYYRFISRSDVLERRLELMPSNALSVICKFKYLKTPEAINLSEAIKHQGSSCNEMGEIDDDTSSYQEKCMTKPMKCQGCGDFVELKSWSDHKCEMVAEAASKKLLNDLKELMQSGVHSDTIVKVKGEEFRLHRNILAIRNPYFQSMFKNDMKEKNTGVVSIDDCEPDTFKSFIHFVYTGKVDKLTPENVCGLYELADKYQQDELKEECLHLMMNAMSVDSLCDFIVLALRHDEKKLLQKATIFFCSKAKEILRHVKWQTFMAEYPTQANELYIKALDNSDG